MFRRFPTCPRTVWECRRIPMSDVLELQRLGIRPTLPRLELLRLFREMPTSHLSADAIYRLMVSRGSAGNLATIYRCLAALEKGGLLKHSRDETGKAFYELNTGQNHGRLVCSVCGRVQAFQSNAVFELHKAIAKAHGFELQDHAYQLQVRCLGGVCP